MPSNSSLSLRTYLGYGLGDFGFNLIFQFTGLYLLIFYTDELGLEAATAGNLFIIARIWDGINDPIMGYLAGRNRSRWGKFRPFLLWGAFPLGLSLVLLFYAPELSPDSKLLYAALTYLFFGASFTAVNVPFGALTASMTKDYHTRSQLTGWRMTLGIVGGMVAASLALPLITAWGGGKQGYLITAIIFATLAVVTIWFAFSQVKEAPAPQKRVHIAFTAAWQMIRKNGPFISLTLCFVCNFITLSLFSGMLPYYFEYFLGEKAWQSIAISLMFGSAAASVPFWVWFAKKYSKKTVYLTGGSLYLFALILLFLVGKPGLPIICILFIMKGIGAGSSAFAGWAMLPDTIEYGQWKTGIRATGILYGVYGFFFKAGIGIGIWLAGTGLSLAAYVPNVPQSPETQQGIQYLSSLIPGIFILFSLIALSYYSIGPELHQHMLQDMEEKS